MSRSVHVTNLSPTDHTAFRELAKARGSEAWAAREVFAAGLKALQAEAKPSALPSTERLSATPKKKAAKKKAPKKKAPKKKAKGSK